MAATASLGELSQHLICTDESLDDIRYNAMPAFSASYAALRRSSTSTSSFSATSISAPSSPWSSSDAKLARQVLASITPQFYTERKLRDVVALGQQRHAAKMADSVLAVVSPSLRASAVAFVAWAAAECDTGFETVAHALDLLDRIVVARPGDALGCYPLLAAVCFGIACKFQFDSASVRMDDICGLLFRYPYANVDYRISTAYAAEIERFVMRELEYDLSTVTVGTAAINILPYFACAAEHYQQFAEHVLLAVSYTAGNSFLAFPPHTCAVAAIRWAMLASPALNNQHIYANGLAHVLGAAERNPDEELTLLANACSALDAAMTAEQSGQDLGLGLNDDAAFGLEATDDGGDAFFDEAADSTYGSETQGMYDAEVHDVPYDDEADDSYDDDDDYDDTASEEDGPYDVGDGPAAILYAAAGGVVINGH